MKVIDYSPCEWCLLSCDDKFILNVNCSFSFVSTGVTIELNSHERKNYMRSGRSFIVELAGKIGSSAFIKGTTIYQRNIPESYSSLVHETILKFNQENNI